MKIYIHKTHLDSSQVIAKKIIDFVNQKQNTVLGLATGSTPELLYQELINDHIKNKTSYQDVITFNLDEYLNLEPTHPQSYQHYMKEKLFNKIAFKNNYLLCGVGNINQNILEYEKLLKNHPIDIQILGIGTNGHIGFNEPGSSLESKTRVVSLTYNTINDNKRFFEEEKEVPKKAITMGIGNILKAKKIYLIASGKQKAKAILSMIKGDVTPNCPASVLQNHQDVEVFLDEDASYLL